MRLFILPALLCATVLVAACAAPYARAASLMAQTGALAPDTTTAPGTTFRPVGDPGHEARLEAAVEIYEQTRFVRAADEFDVIASDREVPRALRIEALRYLGRLHVALGRHNDADDTMRRLVELEPPSVELDPDVEPPPLLHAYYRARMAADGGYAVRTDRRQTIAIVNFNNNSITDHERWEPMQQGFASLMTHAMGPAIDLELVERERIRWLLEEHDLQRDPSLIEQETAVRAGRLLGAQTVAIGSFIINRRDLILSARLVEVETGKILFSEQVRGRVDDFHELLEKLSLHLARTIKVQLAAAQVETRSLEAALAYSEGLMLIEHGDYEAAYAHFERALGFDPEYVRASSRLQSLRLLIASR